MSLVLGLEHFCPWPREGLSSERLSLALASDCFCVLGLGLEPCVLDSNSAMHSGSLITLTYRKVTFSASCITSPNGFSHTALLALAGYSHVNRRSSVSVVFLDLSLGKTLTSFDALISAKKTNSELHKYCCYNLHFDPSCHWIVSNAAVNDPHAIHGDKH